MSSKFLTVGAIVNRFEGRFDSYARNLKIRPGWKSGIALKSRAPLIRITVSASRIYGVSRPDCAIISVYPSRS